MFEAPYLEALGKLELSQVTGKLTAISGMLLEAKGCSVRMGELVSVIQPLTTRTVLAEVVGLKADSILLMPLQAPEGLCLDSRVRPVGKPIDVGAGNELLGRVVNGLGDFLDGEGKRIAKRLRTAANKINPLDREAITETLASGVKSIDLFCTMGKGMRIGIFAGSGVGKSTLLGMLATNSEADVIVVCLIGERGREVGEFVRDIQASNGFTRCVVVAATADEPAIMRRQAAFTATTIAEYFRDLGKDVLLIMDSITRLAMAQREVGLAAGESLGARGYPASVFAILPPLVERVGNLRGVGSISAIYTVLVEGDDMQEPITDHMRSLLDGHVVLSRSLAEKGHYPAVDILSSLSRLAPALLNPDQQSTVSALRAHLSAFHESKDMIELGAYEAGSNTVLDKIVEFKGDVDEFLQQKRRQFIEPDDVWRDASQVVEKLIQ
ncbi:FliI/YscN family ATPase [Teredinibacter franksiae]|uniref:FliI/YscN family ATPase n=1 Tax=Teredinibacter franksiae TaxID=2761453 RepID=UPI001624E805|nr:FliI/YscN family ATPase [Teredinibacter franksiae]